MPGLARFPLEGRVVVITGARGGLGLAMARGMAAAGARVGINGRDADRAERAAAEIPHAFAVTRRSRSTTMCTAVSRRTC